MWRQSHMYLKSCEESEAFLLKCKKNRKLLLMKSFLQPKEGWSKRDVFISFSSAHSLVKSRSRLVSVTEQLHWFCVLLKGTALEGVCRTSALFLVTFFRSYHLIPHSDTVTWHLRATAAPLRRGIISLRLFGAAPVFSREALLIWTWCIARLQTIV